MAYKEPTRRTIRLDDDVWEAVRAMPVSLNVFLRRSLLSGDSPFSNLDVVARPAGSLTGKASVETWRRAPRQKGDKTR